MNRIFRRNGGCAVLAAGLALLSATTAYAMEWTGTVEGLTIVYTGTGEIVSNDAEKLKALIATPLEPKGTYRYASSLELKKTRPQVRLNSPGGNVFGGLVLGQFIRESGLDTLVPEAAQCHSACTMAFLGGVSRTVKGKFGIHAMSLDPAATAAMGGGNKSRGVLDDFQALSSVFITYTRDMLGKSDMAEVTLRLGSTGINIVGDTELRDWQVITVASRPTQRYGSSVLSAINCGSVANFTLIAVACDDLTLARVDIRVGHAFSALRPRVDAKALDADQARWIAHLNDCKRRAASVLNPNEKADFIGDIFRETLNPTGMIVVEACLRRDYDLRVRELESLVEYHNVRDESLAASGWRNTK